MRRLSSIPLVTSFSAVAVSRVYAAANVTSASSSAQPLAASKRKSGTFPRQQQRRRRNSPSAADANTTPATEAAAAATHSPVTPPTRPVPPIRRRSTANGGNRTPRQNKEALLLQALAAVDVAARGERATGTDNELPPLTADDDAPAEEEPCAVATATAAAAKAAGVGSLSNQQLLTQIGAVDFVSKLQEALSSLAAPLTGWWARGPSDATLRRLERQLDLAVQQGSFEAYSALRQSMRQRLEGPLASAAAVDSASEQLLLLYARVLASYGAFCLLNSEPQKAISLLREAIATTERASAAAKVATATGTEQTTSSTITSTSGSSGTALDGPYGATAVLYLRLLLANALSCERLYWQAAEQYVEALRVLDENPYDAGPDAELPGSSPAMLVQVSPGRAAIRELSRQFITEDAQGFFRDGARLTQAVVQGQAQELLLQSQGAPAQRLSRLRLTMARMFRYGVAFSVNANTNAGAGPSASSPEASAMIAESRRLYELYLDDLITHEQQDDQHGMAELGRMLCEYPVTDSADTMNNVEEVTKQVQAGIIYLEAASESLLEDAENALLAKEANGSSGRLTPSQLQLVVRTVSVLIDAAQAQEQNENDAAALGLFEGSLDLLARAGLWHVSAWVLQRYADVLSSVSFVDKAILKYTAAIDVLRANEQQARERAATGRLNVEGPGPSDTPLQVGPRQRMVSLTSVDVEAGLAYCHQVYVGDIRRAVWHYENVLASVLSGTTATAERSSPSRHGGGGRRRRTAPLRAKEELAALMPMEREHFVLTNMVACCERLQEWECAIAAQNRLISLESTLGTPPVAACVRSVCLMAQTSDYTTMLSVLFYLLLLPENEVDVPTRMLVTHHFVKCCYALGNQTMGTILLNAVRQVEGDHNPSVVLEWALNTSKLDELERLYVYDFADMKTGIRTITDTFLRAAQMLVAQRISDDADAAANGGLDPSGPLDVDRERASLITLSRGAFFFHQNGFNKQAEELYATAVGLADSTPIPEAGAAPEAAERRGKYNHELAILLANYATLVLATDPAKAAVLYARAAVIQPAPLEVAEVVADYYVQSGNYIKGAAHMARVVEAHPEAAVDMYGRLARLGCGQPWATFTAAQRLEVVEFTVLGLGVTASRLPTYAAAAVGPTTEANVGARVAALDALMLEGVSTTPSDEAACVACFLVQTKFSHKAGFINRLCRVAVKRFPFHTALLVNYAKFCCDFGFHALARKLYARAYGASDGDFWRTLCYVNYLSSTYGATQTPAGEALYRRHAEANPESSQANMYYANFLAVMIPTPFKTEEYFQKALSLDPKSKQIGQYAQFVWACADNPVAHQSGDVRAQLFDKAESLFKMAVDIEPENPVALQNLGNFYANRRGKFEETVETLYKAHKLSPTSADVARQLCAVLLEECLRMQTEEQQRFRAAAKQGPAADSSTLPGYTPTAPRLRSLTDSTHQVFEKCVELDPSHRETMEKYAGFAVAVLRNPTLAADLWTRINHLGPK